MAKFQAFSTWDPWNKPLYSLHLYSLWSENSKISNKKTQKEKKKQYCLEHEWAWNNSAPTPAPSRTPKNLSHITGFNNDKNGHYATKYPKPKKNKNTLKD